jgi:hypothetical protein
MKIPRLDKFIDVKKWITGDQGFRAKLRKWRLNTY